MITTRQIEALCAVMDAGSITRASERLRLSQPAVSKLIASLERETGLALFERRNRRLVATPEAGRLYNEAQRVFVGLIEVGRLAEELRSLNSGALVIASLAALGRGQLPKLAARFLSEHPQVTLTYQVRSSNKVTQWAIAQQLDLGIAMAAMEHPAVETETLCTVDAVCVLPKDHPLASRQVINVEDLHEVRFISFGREGRMRHIIDGLFESRGVQPQLVVETFNSEIACSLAAQGLGASIVEPFSAVTYADGLAVRRFLPAIRYEFKLLFPRFRPRSRLAEAFAAFLRTEIACEAEMLRLG